MLRLRTILLVSLAFLFINATAKGDTTFIANLTNSQENPPTNPTTTTGVPRVSFGNAIFVLNSAQTAMTFSATIFGIDITGVQSADTNDNLLAAHIHAGPLLPPGNNPVVWGFFGSPFNDNNPNDVVMTPFSNAVGFTISGKWDAAEGNGTTLSAQLANIFAGRSYINFHTQQFGGGEIRGQLIATPEPSALLLLGTGTVGLFGLIRRKRNTLSRGE